MFKLFIIILSMNGDVTGTGVEYKTMEKCEASVEPVTNAAQKVASVGSQAFGVCMDYSKFSKPTT